MIMANCTGIRCQMRYGYKVDECNHTDCPYRTEPMTNADRIRAMSDEGLANIIVDNVLTGACNDFDIPGKNPCPNNCMECVLEWLKKPVGVE